MSSNGKDLERIVASIEKLLLGKGFTVTANDKVFDGEGNQIAEFDISIEGKIGSTSFKWLIECRDRPSEGPAPGSWIEQLSGRKRRFGFDKVIAVSTTGFSIGANKAAKELNITLREVSNVQEMSNQFGKIEFRLSKVNLSLGGPAAFKFPRETEKEVKEIFKGIKELNDPKVRFVGESNFLTLKQFILRDHYDNKQVKKPEVDETREVIFEELNKMELLVGNRILRIKGFSVPITLEYSFHSVDVLTIKSYGEDGAVIGEEVAISTETPDEIIRTVVIITKKNGKVHVEQNDSFEILTK
ncbi:MAG: hypothetical protein ABIJ37_11460 [Pseudomonadota bacterium]